MMKKAELLYYTLKNQYLLEKASMSEVVTNLCGLQAQFANNTKYALHKWRKDNETLYITPLTKLSNQHRDGIISRGKKLFRDEIKCITFVE